MSKFFKNPLLVAIATGINTIALATIHANVTDEGAQLAYSACTPFICNMLVLLIDWLLASKNVKSAEHLRMEHNLKDQITIAKANLKDAKESGLPTEEFEARLVELMQARTNIPDLVNQQRLTQ
ncbi:hypothetical protein [Pseudoalteromonas sp. T1lg10]|uniref:hypothetical protein n=1 Tax=Pseudoalteromonas sp. T1lg10 TaxID=2077093 RepID=UPI000CF6EC92|nr:hypothetical protein [Pseudoalteromonas sp. T1lg10]